MSNNQPVTSPTSSPYTLTTIPRLDPFVRFTLLYFTTLFSLDSWTAARNSPFSLPNSSAIVTERSRRTEFGGDRRLDPGGEDPARRRGGFGGGGAGKRINATPCAGCHKPQVS